MSNGTDNFPKMPPYPEKSKATTERAVSPAESVETDFIPHGLVPTDAEQRLITHAQAEYQRGYEAGYVACHNEEEVDALRQRAEAAELKVAELRVRTQEAEEHARLLSSTAQPLQQEGGKEAPASDWPKDFREVIKGAEDAAYQQGRVAGLEEAAQICSRDAVLNVIRAGAAAASRCADAIRALAQPSDNLQQASTAEPDGRDVHRPLLIARIKRYRKEFGCTLKEAKEACEYGRDMNGDETAFLSSPTSAAQAEPAYASPALGFFNGDPASVETVSAQLLGKEAASATDDEQLTPEQEAARKAAEAAYAARCWPAVKQFGALYKGELSEFYDFAWLVFGNGWGAHETHSAQATPPAHETIVAEAGELVCTACGTTAQATPEGDNSQIIAEGLEAAHTLINMIPTRLENHDTEAIARIGEFVNEKGGFNAINSARNAWLAASQQAAEPVCATCKGVGMVGGPVGQTPESFDYVSEDCPDCTPTKTAQNGVQDLRHDFEMWKSRRGEAAIYAGDGQYESSIVQGEWEAWCDSAALYRAAPPQQVDESGLPG